MSQQIEDPDVRKLASIASLLQSDYEENEDWIGSPFDWIKTRPSRQVGKIGEQLVSGWCAANNSPIWLEIYGGTLSQAFQILSDLQVAV